MMTYDWYEVYKAAVLETEWTTMPVRLEAAEEAIHKRQRVLSTDHGGTPEERQAIADALSGIKSLKDETAGWQDRKVSGGERTESGSD